MTFRSSFERVQLFPIPISLSISLSHFPPVPIFSNTRKTTNDEQPRQWEPCTACYTVPSCVAFSTSCVFLFFFFPVHFFFRAVQHVPATLAPTTSYCRPPNMSTDRHHSYCVSLPSRALPRPYRYGAQYPATYDGVATPASEPVSALAHLPVSHHTHPTAPRRVSRLCDGHHVALSFSDAVATTALGCSVPSTSVHYPAAPRHPTTLWPPWRSTDRLTSPPRLVTARWPTSPHRPTSPRYVIRLANASPDRTMATTSPLRSTARWPTSSPRCRTAQWLPRHAVRPRDATCPLPPPTMVQ